MKEARKVACPLFSPGGLVVRALGGAGGLEADGAGQLAVDAADALHLALGGEALVEPLRAEVAHALLPRREEALPAFDAILTRSALLRSEERRVGKEGR